MDKIHHLEPKEGFQYNVEQEALDAVMDALEPFNNRISNVCVFGVLEIVKANYLFAEE